ncbi:hypothetical protein E0485_22650 [Paenibacillus albiflavus]|uniref:Uncharacterized protein n=1 Tax=Paenibacillus albiflavus TaxID=2545760 RepID=A0A4R4DZ81_9BACL|nr:hypothetical protein E0485_22650 [Paenibacillus albiflavus]
MYITLNVQSNIEIRSLLDLPKLKSLMENLNMKINKSQLARDSLHTQSLGPLTLKNIPKIPFLNALETATEVI